MTDFSELIATLTKHGVQFIVVGGAAATAHGSARLTQDLDVVYARTPGNTSRIVNSLAAYNPYPRGAPAGLPFRWDEQVVKNGLNFTLSTNVGDLDLLGEITGGGGYSDLLPHSIHLTLFGCDCLCLDLDCLIHVKRAAGRPKDFEAIAELEAIREDRAKGSRP